jgi:hypothetical protein
MLQAVDSMIVPGCRLAAHESTLSRCFRAYWMSNFCGGRSNWETALEHDDPHILLEAAVVSALNSYLDLMGENALAGDQENFITAVTQAAHQWAQECFNFTTDH